MAWGWVQSNSAVQGGGGTTFTVSYTTANVTAGTKLIAAIGFSTAGGGVTSVTDAAANAMTLVGTAGVAGVNLVYLYAMDTPAGDVGTKRAAPSQRTLRLSNGIAMVLQEVSGLAVGNTLAAMVDGTAGAQQRDQFRACDHRRLLAQQPQTSTWCPPAATTATASPTPSPRRTPRTRKTSTPHRRQRPDRLPELRRNAQSRRPGRLTGISRSGRRFSSRSNFPPPPTPPNSCRSSPRSRP